MNLMNHIERGRAARPRRIMVYGTHGIGKSTFGATAPRPIFIPDRSRPATSAATRPTAAATAAVAMSAAG
ncbi:MAG: AAA family ATPase, partial [Phycisphaerales bacterium]